MIKNEIIIKNIVLRSGKKKVLDNLSFTLPADKVILLEGEYEDGTLFLLKILAGVLPPDKGEVSINGKNLYTSHTEKEREVKKGIGVLFKNGGMISNLTIAENLMLPLLYHYRGVPEEKLLEIIEKRLNEYGLAGYENSRPAELTDEIKKVAGFIRMNILDPELLILDDPFHNCGVYYTKLLLDKIKESKQFGKGMIILNTSGRSLEEIADFSLQISNGKRIRINEIAH